MFTHLHVHTEFSMLDGLSRLDSLVARAAELGMDSLAITDHGGLYGAIDFYRLARAAGLKPIIGCEMYVALESRHSRDPRERSPYHLTVLARDATGYQNLVKLVTISHLEGFYQKPRVDREVLERYSGGLVVLSGCPSGEVPRYILEGRWEQARQAAAWYRQVFGDGYFLEIMRHPQVPELGPINEGLLRLSRELDIPPIATNDCHYTYREEAPLQDIFICIQTNTNINDERRLRMAGDSYYLKSPREMEELFQDLPEALANTRRVAEMCDLELDLDRQRLPQYPVPEGQTADEYLARLCREGLERRLPDHGPQERERLEYELEVIRQTRFANYFLVVWDITRFARQRDIFFAVRGSAAASLVLYCLGVTNVNPLEYGLVFERFLNVERRELPDIDMDFQDDRREEVINYVVDRYGRDHVAQICTFGTLGARAAIRDVGRALAMTYAEVDRVARLVPFRLHITLDEAMELNPELRQIYEADEAVRRLVDTARRLEGLARHISTHAAGVVISQEPLDTVVPLQRSTRAGAEGATMTQYSMEPLAALGLLKMDFLGLTNLTILARALELIAQTRGKRIELSDIPLDDAKTFQLLARGETVGIFQLEGAGMTRYLKKLKPSSVRDVAAMIALYRPGPMEHIDTFIARKHGLDRPDYPHPALRDILEETYGVIVYQDQVLHIARQFAGYSLGEADVVRKAMGKKIPEIMAQERERFIQGALGQGYSRELAERIFQLIEPFAGYAFNKAHSVSYGLVSYYTAYLKANYPAEFMTAFLNCYRDNADKIASAVADCQRMGIPVLPPDVNKSGEAFTIERAQDGGYAIRFGLAAVKNVGSSAIRPFLESRDREGPFTSIEHVCQVADMSALNRKALESLIKAGAFDAFGDRTALLGAVERILTVAQSEARRRRSNQVSMFELLGGDDYVPTVELGIPTDVQTPSAQKRAWERELLGVALSDNLLLAAVSQGADPDTVVTRADLDADMEGERVVLVGQVASVSRRYTRDQRPFAIVDLELLGGSVEVVVWSELLEQTGDLWQEGRLVRVVGSVRARDDEVSVSCHEAQEHVVAEHPVAAPPTGVVAPGRSANGLERADAPAEADTGPPRGRPSKVAEIAPSMAPDNGAAPPQREQTLDDASVKTRLLTLRLRESGRPDEDAYLLEDLRRVLLEYKGQDEVRLEIVTGRRVVVMEWPMVRVNACPELEARLKELIGPEGVTVAEREGP